MQVVFSPKKIITAQNKKVTKKLRCTTERNTTALHAILFTKKNEKQTYTIIEGTKSPDTR